MIRLDKIWYLISLYQSPLWIPEEPQVKNFSFLTVNCSRSPLTSWIPWPSSPLVLLFLQFENAFRFSEVWDNIVTLPKNKEKDRIFFSLSALLQFWKFWFIGLICIQIWNLSLFLPCRGWTQLKHIFLMLSGTIMKR